MLSSGAPTIRGEVQSGEIGFVSGVIPLAKDDPIVRVITGSMSVKHSKLAIVGGAICHDFDRLTIDKGYIITAMDPDKRDRKRKYFEEMRQKREQGA
jgi:hypothetical protein